MSHLVRLNTIEAGLNELNALGYSISDSETDDTIVVLELMDIQVVNEMSDWDKLVFVDLVLQKAKDSNFILNEMI